MSRFTQWRAQAREPRFSEWLRAHSEPEWTATVTHPFTDDLLRGVLPDAKMRRYLVQDYRFIDHFVALVGAAIASADRYASRVPLARFLGMATSDENTYFLRAFDALEVPERDRTAPAVEKVTGDFTALMDEARREASYPYCLSVIAVAEWSYLSWARRASEPPPQSFVHHEWITLHDNPEFREFVGWLTAELDRLGPELAEHEQQRCLDLFRRATELERAFFDMAYA